MVLSLFTDLICDCALLLRIFLSNLGLAAPAALASWILTVSAPVTFSSRPPQLLPLLNTAGLSPNFCAPLNVYIHHATLPHQPRSCSLSLLMTRTGLTCYIIEFPALLLPPSLFFILISFLFSFLLMLSPWLNVLVDPSALSCSSSIPALKPSHSKRLFPQSMRRTADPCHWKGVALVSSKHSVSLRHQ